MDLTTITITDFKNLFYRDFPYLPVWQDTVTYNTGDEVYYETNGLFYRCLSDGVTALPTDTTKWTRMTAEKVYNYILDADITKAFSEAKMNFNQGLFSTDEEIQAGYLYLTAHYLVFDTRTAMQGINSVGDHNVSSRSVGNVSESYDIPERFKNDPFLSFLSKTGYGMKYANMIIPRMIGNIGTAWGITHP